VPYNVVCNGIFTLFPSIAEEYVGAEDLCQLLMVMSDLNDDSHINFREFTFIVMTFAKSGGFGQVSQAIGVNCSSCVGMEHYNAIYIRN